MKNQKGFIGLPVILAIVLGIAVLGGGTYFVTQKSKNPQGVNVGTETVYQCPDGQIQFGGSDCLGHTTLSTTTQSIAIDQKSLVATSDTVTIVGTATGLKEVVIEVRDPERAGTIGDVIASKATPVVSGQWSFVAPAPSVGKHYSVAVYSHEFTDSATYNKYYDNRLKIIRGSTQAITYTKYGPLLLEVGAEGYGYSRLSYEFAYPKSDFSIGVSSDNKKIMIKEIATGKINTVNITDESGRGMSSQDYWTYTLKPSCADCAQVANPVSIKDVQNLITFANKDKEWIIFSKGEWLFAAELQKPATEVEKILSSFAFVAPLCPTSTPPQKDGLCASDFVPSAYDKNGCISGWRCAKPIFIN